MQGNLEAALRYLKLGLSIIPIKPPKKDKDGEDENKRPFIEWTPYQEQRPTEKEVRQWWTKWPNARIAIVCGPISGLYVVDTDSEEARERLEEMLPESLITPIAKTPRPGHHYYFRSENGLRNKIALWEKCDTKGDGGYIIAPPSAGLDGKSYQWLPGLQLGNVEPAELPAALASLIKNNSLYSIDHTREHLDHTRPQMTTRDHMLFTEGHRDNGLFHVANHLVKGGMPAEEIEQILRLMASKICEPAFPQSEIPIKIQSALQRAQSLKDNIAQDVREWVMTTNGHFLTTDAHKELQLTTRDHKKAAVMAFQRLLKEGVIERASDRRGHFRLVETDFSILEIGELPDIDPVDIRLPFGMEEYVEIMPKDLIVYAGVPNSGKTALLLETVRLNMGRHKCWYFSTEMSRYNVKKRIAKHAECQEWQFKFSDDIPNFWDPLKPDDLNFIDYVEAPDGDAYKVPSILTKIQKRLKNGLCIAALQKNPERDYAIGGFQTRAKPALFCTIEPDYPGAIIKMVKAKNRKSINPNGYIHKFKILDGINIKGQGSWEPEI